MLKSSLAIWAATMLTASAASAVTLPNVAPKKATAQVLPEGQFGTIARNMSSSNQSTSSAVVAYECMTASGSYLSVGTASPVDGLHYDEYGDDCHLTFSGPLSTFCIGYFKPGGGTVDAIITFYTNDAVDGIIGAVVAGPYLVTGLPSGLNTVLITPPDAPVMPVDVWYAIRFSVSTAGLVIAGAPPTVGSSHDIFVDTGLFTPPPGLVFFGGSPVANFMTKVELEGPVPVEHTTWGGLKALFEND